MIPMKQFKKVEIFYLSNLCTENVVNYLHKTLNRSIGQEAQKFHQLLIEGLGMYPDACEIQTLSVIPVVSATHKRIFWNFSSEKVGNILYNYVPMINLPLLKDFMVFVYSFFKVLSWSFGGKGKNKIFICDSLKFSISCAAILASKFSKVKVVGIVTDLPDLMVGNKKKYDLKYKIYKSASYSLISNFDKYIILTDQMNAVVNPHNKPHIVMEGLVDIKMKLKDNSLNKKKLNRVLLYTGGIYEKYGIKNLIKAFMKIEDENLRLHIYGPGDMEKEMPGFMKEDERVVYKGVVPNADVVECQLMATLLINPRPTNENYTKFSFPSKNMEYMVSGTPMVTTKLPGMPLEYYDYVYFFEDESVEGMSNTLKILLQKNDNELRNFGKEAKEFVLNKKSNLIQANRIIEFLNPD